MLGLSCFQLLNFTSDLGNQRPLFRISFLCRQFVHLTLTNCYFFHWTPLTTRLRPTYKSMGTGQGSGHVC
uniref:Ovule protein n=1 Tax=Romanomermis culicivorax TaxID=13658 RepID=A0A915HGB9_ROMCU